MESEADAMQGVMEDDEETVEMESPVKAFEESMDEVKTMTPTSLRSADSLEQLDLADSTPCRSEGEGSSGDAWTPAVTSRSDEEPTSEEKQPQPRQVQYGLEKFFFGRKEKPAIEEHKVEILKDGGLLKRGRGRPTREAAALMEARKKGELLVVAAVKDFNRAVKEEAAMMLKMKKNKRAPGEGTPDVAAKVEARLVKADVGGPGSMLLVKNSNRALKGANKKRHEEGAATKLEMAEKMESVKAAFATEADWRHGMCKMYGKPWKTLKKIVEGKEEWQDRVKKLKLGKGSTGTTAAKGSCSKGGRWLKQGGIGARKKGAGRKDEFAHIKCRVKYWLEKERSMCHHVDRVDLVEEFMDQCEDEVEECIKELEKRKNKDEGDESKEVEDKKVVKKLSFSAALQGDMQVTAEDEDLISAEEYVQQLDDLEFWRLKLQERIERLKTSEKYMDTFGGRLMRDIGAKLMQPGRMSVLSMEEEEARVKATWKDFDVVLWLAAFGSEEELEKFVGSPQKFIEDRTEVVVGFSDQIPVWVKIGRKKEVFCEREVKPRLDSKAFMKLQKERLKQQVLKEAEEAEEAQDEEEQKQLEDSKPDEEEDEKVEDSRPDEENEKKVEDKKEIEVEGKKEIHEEGCQPHGEEEEKVEEKKVIEEEGSKPVEEDDGNETDEDMPGLVGGWDEGEDKMNEWIKKMEEERNGRDSDSEDEDGPAVPLQDMEVEDDNLSREMEGVEQAVEEAGTVTAGEIP